MLETNYTVTTTEVHGGYDLTISNDEYSATLFIQDLTQANAISQQLICIAKEQKISINAAFSIFNQGSGMFAQDNLA